MSDWYNNPRVEEIIKEQADKMPKGPLGFFDKTKDMTGDINEELLLVWRQYLNDEITNAEFHAKTEMIKDQIKHDKRRISSKHYGKYKSNTER